MISFKKYILLSIACIILLLSGCGSSSSPSSSNSQEILFSDYMMMINPGFISIPIENIVDHRFKGFLLAAYSIPTPSTDFFEKNIIISQDVLGKVSFDTYVVEAIAGIKKTRGGYGNANITKENLSCNGQNLPAQRHVFTIQRGELGKTGQLLSFVQYFFAKSNKITIISSSTDDTNDLQALNSYMDSIQCLSGSTINSIQ